MTFCHSKREIRIRELRPRSSERGRGRHFETLKKMLRLADPIFGLDKIRMCLCRLGIALSIMLVALTSSAFAVDGQADSRPDGKPQNFDYLILALSWSPTYCAANSRRLDERQCQAPANHGFVVHGLWPQAMDGARLRCPAGKGEFSKALFERTLEIFPDLDLAQMQWQRHGHCFGFAADAYLEKAGAARAKLVIPERFRNVDQIFSLSGEAIRESFVNANSNLTAQSVAISCRKGELVEVLVCLKNDLSSFEPCPQIAQRSCRAATLRIPAAQAR